MRKFTFAYSLLLILFVTEASTQGAPRGIPQCAVSKWVSLGDEFDPLIDL
jgi:hypothetical protein